ncbi:hypothetical protein ACFWPX_02980 [Nocardia sp. NPDC058518]|uniref:hypothetical protein n=1 Tax=Nocardia sp. NPDC058518 TaxID=3346534 RepID=UPI003665E55B
MEDVVVWVSVVAAAVLFLVGIVDLAIGWTAKGPVRTAADNAAKIEQAATENKETLERHSGIDLKGQWEALAALAAAMKDLDRSSRLFFLSLAFLAVAGVTVGLSNIGAGIGAA